VLDRRDRLDVHHAPVLGRGGGVGVRLARDACDPHDLLSLVRVVVEAEVADLHRAQVVPRLEVPDPFPHRPPVADELWPRVLRGLALDQPVLSKGHPGADHSMRHTPPGPRDSLGMSTAMSGSPATPRPPTKDADGAA